MVFTYVHLLGVVITLVYLAVLFYANRIKQFAFYESSYKENNPGQSGFWNNLMIFGDIIVVAYLVNSANLSAFEPLMIVGAVVVAIIYEVTGHINDRQQKSNEAEVLVPASYITAKRKVSILKNIIALVWFAYLISAF